MQIGASRIEAIDADAYRVVGSTRDGRHARDLAFARRMSCLVYMPRAAVTGWLSVDGVPRAVATAGHHAHSSGEWIPTGVLWNGAQYSEPDLAFEPGDFAGKPVGTASIEVQAAPCSPRSSTCSRTRAGRTTRWTGGRTRSRACSSPRARRRGCGDRVPWSRVQGVHRQDVAPGSVRGPRAGGAPPSDRRATAATARVPAVGAPAVSRMDY